MYYILRWQVVEARKLNDLYYQSPREAYFVQKTWRKTEFSENWTLRKCSLTKSTCSLKINCFPASGTGIFYFISQSQGSWYLAPSNIRSSSGTLQCFGLNQTLATSKIYSSKPISPEKLHSQRAICPFQIQAITSSFTCLERA